MDWKGNDAADIVSVEFPKWAILKEVTLIDRDTVKVVAVDLEDVVSPGAKHVLLVKVTLKAKAEGANALDVRILKLHDDKGMDVPCDVIPGIVAVLPPGPPEIVPGVGPPADRDGDGLLEDINNNGRLDFDDVVKMFKHRDRAREHFKYFDFNRNGRFDFDDIVKLFKLVAGA